MLHMLASAQQGGVVGTDNILDDCKTGSTEIVAVVDMMLAYAQQRGADNVLDD